MTYEEATKFIQEFLDMTSSQLSMPRHLHIKTCAECDQEIGRHGGWGRCGQHYKKRKRHAIKAACVELLGGSCSKCGGVFPQAAFDLHHKEDKLFTIGSYAKSYSVERLAREVVKCELLCANCHRLEHAHDHF